MSSELNIIDIATSIMRSVNKAMATMVGIKLTELPEVKRLEISNIRIFTPSDVYTAVVTYQQGPADRSGKGGVVLYISKSDLRNIFGPLGVDSNSSPEEIKDMCGEFCNVIAGGFKTEIVALGYKELSMTTPTIYSGNVNLPLEGITVSCKYKFSFSHDNASLFVVEAFAEGVI